MIYTINILKERIAQHQKEIDKLNAIEDIEMNAEQLFIDEDIENQNRSIIELQQAILTLENRSKKNKDLFGDIISDVYFKACTTKDDDGWITLDKETAIKFANHILNEMNSL